MTTYSHEDILILLKVNSELSVEKLTQQSLQYPDLFDTSAERPLLHKRWHSLIFDGKKTHDDNITDDMSGENNEAGRRLTAKHYELLCGKEWREIQASHLPALSGIDQVLDHDEFVVDLSDVPPPHALSQFNLLSQNRGIKVKEVTDQAKEISPSGNIAVSLSLTLCKSGVGMLLWQQKLRRNPPSNKEKQGSVGGVAVLGTAQIADKSAPAWQRVPDLMYYEFKWLHTERAAFQSMTYDQQRDFVCADLRLQSDDRVLPFVVDFFGETLKDDEDARITADIDGMTAPMAAICLPGAAFVGWVRDMIPDPNDEKAMRECYRKGSFRRKENEFIMSAEQKERTRVRDQEEMAKVIKSMYKEPLGGAVVFYEQVMYILEAAMDSES